MHENLNWKLPDNRQVIRTVDMHTAGEPLRIITDGLPGIRGATILEKRKFFRDNYDHIRKGIMWEPRGHADMYGAVVTEPVNEGSDFGIFFLHNEGYSTMCGHAMIAIVKIVLETGMIKKDDNDPELNIDAPPGLIIARAVMKDGIVKVSSFRNVPSFVLYKDQTINVPGIGEVKFDVAYGGAFYAFCDAAQLGLNLNVSGADRLIDYGRKIKLAVSENFEIKHPFEDDLGFLYGTIFTGNACERGNHSRNVCIFADGELDRSPTGSGVSARAAIHYSRSELEKDETITIESILGTTMDVRVTDNVKYGPYDAVVPEVTATSYFTGKHEFYFDPDDPLREGFLIR